jgi:hypothetical protein
MPHQPLTKPRLTQHVRSRMAGLIQDDSGLAADAFAIYTLSDPRDGRGVRYVGQTRSPTKRFLQHVNTARLWLPDEAPWWFKRPELRPLYEWMRELHQDEYRLPLMIITDWAVTGREARDIERRRIFDYLSQKLPLLNIEAESKRGQMPLL